MCKLDLCSVFDYYAYELLSVLFIGTHQFFIFPHFHEIATPWHTPMSVKMHIACLLIQMSLDEIMGVCLSLAPYLFCICEIVFDLVYCFPTQLNCFIA